MKCSPSLGLAWSHILLDAKSSPPMGIPCFTLPATQGYKNKSRTRETSGEVIISMSTGTQGVLPEVGLGRELNKGLGRLLLFLPAQFF